MNDNDTRSVYGLSATKQCYYKGVDQLTQAVSCASRCSSGGSWHIICDVCKQVDASCIA